MPVIGHDSVRENSHAGTFLGLRHYFIKSLVVGAFLKYRSPTVAPIQNVLSQSAWGNARSRIFLFGG